MFVRKLETTIADLYFHSVNLREQQEPLEMINNLHLASLLRMKRFSMEKIPSKAAWRTLRVSKSEDKLKAGFFSKAHNAARLIIQDPTLATESAELFIALRTVPKQQRDLQTIQENGMRVFLRTVLMKASLLKQGLILQKSSNNQS